jgi:hypothetical protein
VQFCPTNHDHSLTPALDQASMYYNIQDRWDFSGMLSSHLRNKYNDKVETSKT